MSNEEAEATICRALSPDGVYMCDLDAEHQGDHSGPELPTVTLDERVS